MTDKPTFDMQAAERAMLLTALENTKCEGCGQIISDLDHALNELGRVRAENERLSEFARGQEEGWRQATFEIERLREHLKRGQILINEMDQRMPEQATEDADGWINSYRIPVGPWHRILGWARGGVAQ